MTLAFEVSVIIPCWKDEAQLERLLTELRQAETEDAASVQIIVVDAASSESCKLLCQRFSALWSPATPSRGEQLRQGAALAEHPVFWFLHADAHLERHALAGIRRVVDAGADGGYFAFRFIDTHDWQGRLIECLVGWRNRIGVPYGDQGIFARRDAYFQAGQHAAWPLFEEVPLVKGLRRQGLFCRVESGLRVSARRWKRDGWWRRSLRNRLLALGFMLNVSPFRLAKLYSGSPSAGAASKRASSKKATSEKEQ